ncbi:TPR repeat-containing serine/threonine protein kinase [Dolichospermum compactum NIES-806]|uniref:TPR repeat-containing serine/threonine protein kinase n=1 Tax=Dolichospermum compactum NIES-806 TaxID=1973481 RepID=A0A1Z4V999_9CYAN|nr:TPR repeat-containing serine/threonine protein kinase [Dolichospermum compactum NIES-806]
MGIIAIQALTGLSPDQLEKDVENNEIIWQNNATVSPEFAQFLNQMICYDFRQRYASATDYLVWYNLGNTQYNNTIYRNIKKRSPPIIKPSVINPISMKVGTVKAMPC